MLRKFQTEITFNPNNRHFSTDCNILIIKQLQNSSENERWNHAEKRCDLHQITTGFEPKRKMISVISSCKVTEIANERGRNEDAKAIKWLRRSVEMASHKHEKRFFFSIWSSLEVLKTRKKVDRKSKTPLLKTRHNFFGARIQKQRYQRKTSCFFAIYFYI